MENGGKKKGRPYGQHYSEIRQIRLSPRQVRILKQLAKHWDSSEVEVFRRALVEAGEREGISATNQEEPRLIPPNVGVEEVP